MNWKPNRMKLMWIIPILVFVVLNSCKILRTEVDNIHLINNYYKHVNYADTTDLDLIVSEKFIKINNDKISEKIGVSLLNESILNHKKNNKEYEFIVEDIFSEDNKVAVRWTWKSININNGVEKPVVSKGISIFYIENKRIIKLWQSFDLLSFNNQLK